MNPKVSILLPTHNKARLLSFAIRSVLSQSFEDFEVLVVGDGCTDNTAEIVTGFKDKRLIWYDLPKAPNFGYANRNVALREARGDLIAFMAHDDLWLSDHLEQFIRVFENQSVDIAYSRPLWVIPKGMIVPGFFNLDFEPSLTYFLEVGNKIPAGCFVHRNGCFSKYGYWNDQLTQGADWDMWVRIIRGGDKKNYTHIDQPTCLHFKADWHGEEYDRAFEFPAWKLLFDSMQIPAALLVNIAEGTPEQETIWNAMSSTPAEWNKDIRSAIHQMIDFLASQGISNRAKLDSTLSELEFFRTELDATLTKLDSTLTDLDFSRTEIQTARNEIALIKNTLTWKVYENITKIQWIQRIYLGLKAYVLHFHSNIKNW